MNEILISGRMTKEPEIHSTSNNRVASFTLAVDRSFKNPKTGETEADFIPCVVWGSMIDIIERKGHKNSWLVVKGRLQIRNFDAKDGTKHWIAEVVAERIEFPSGQ